MGVGRQRGRCGAWSSGWLVCAGVQLVIGAGCPGPDHVTLHSSTTDASSGSTGTTSTASAKHDDVAPSRTPPEPSVLPEGCGDGVIVPDQYDCFTPVDIEWIPETIGGYPDWYAFDVDGDGRSEAILDGGSPHTIRVLRWIDGELVLGEPVSTFDKSFNWVLDRWDWNGDGRRDVTRFSTAWGDDDAIVVTHPSLGDGRFGAAQYVHAWSTVGTPNNAGRVAKGFGFPIDVDADGVHEVIAARIISDTGESNPPAELVVRKKVGDSWELVGDAFEFGGCSTLWNYAYGDFDEDGHEDIAVLDSTRLCDPHPHEYDPAWYSLAVFLANPTVGQLQLAGWFPLGLIIDENRPVWVHDANHDGHLDLLVSGIPDPGTPGRAALMRGNGDGTFQEGEVLEFDGIADTYRIDARADLDGDGEREWVANAGGTVWILPEDLSAGPVFQGLPLGDPSEGWETYIQTVVGDMNGDGVDDYVGGADIPGDGPQGPSRGGLLLSAP